MVVSARSEAIRRRWTDPVYRERQRAGYKNAKIKKRRCLRCRQWYQPTARCQRYCGKQKVRGTCSWQRGQELTKKFIADHPERVALYQQRAVEKIKNSPELAFLARLRGLKKHLRSLGLTLEQYEMLVARQRGLCAICARSNKRRLNAKDIRLAVDHDHKTTLVRGLLCDFCNAGLGLFKDDPNSLRQAATYLEDHAQRVQEGRPLL